MNDNGTKNVLYSDSAEVEFKSYVVVLMNGVPKRGFGVIAKFDLTLTDKGFSNIFEQTARLKPQSKVNDYIKYIEYTGQSSPWNVGEWLGSPSVVKHYFTHEQEI